MTTQSRRTARSPHMSLFLVSVKGVTEHFAWGISRKRLEEKAEKEFGAEVIVEAPWTPGPLSPTALLAIEPGNEGKTAALIQMGKNASRMERLGTIPPGKILRKGDFEKERRKRRRTRGVASLARRSAKRRIEGKSQDSEVGRRAAVLALWCHGGREAAKLMGGDEPRAEVSDEIRRTMKELGRELEMFFFGDRTYKR